MERLLALNAREARQVWGSVWGERLHYLLQGAELPEVPTTTKSIGHSHVLGPERRHPDRARLVARRLLAKAATRLRRAERRSGWLELAVKAEGQPGTKAPKWHGGERLPQVMDSTTLLETLDRLWTKMLAEFPPRRYLQVAVTLGDLADADAVQLQLFDGGAALDPAAEARRLALARAMDKVNARFGRDAVTIGHDAAGAGRSSGPRIAFTRIPEIAEFHE
jgi:DNA polymerase-4